MVPPMGGYNSGRHDGKALAEQAKRIDLNWMLRTSRLKPGQQGRSLLSWTRGDTPCGSIAYDYDLRNPADAWLTLRFTTTRHGDPMGIDHVQRVRLSFTQPHFGGRRWWMHCPQTGERVAKLYCPAGENLFAGRQAWKLAYQSQRAAPRDKPFDRLNRLQRRLGCREGYEAYISRPKGMWHRTFARHLARYERISADCDSVWNDMAAQLAGFERRAGK